MATKSEKWQNLLHKAYGKVSKQLGRNFSVYRSSVLTKPIQGANWIYQTDIAFSQDWSYGSAHDSGVSIWIAYVDGRYDNNFNIADGDYFYDAEREETYVIVSTQPHLDRRAIRVPNRITVERVGYGDSALGFGATNNTIIGEDVPCFVIGNSSLGESLVPVSTYSKEAMLTFTIYLFDIASEIQIKDKITDENGNVSQVLAITRDDMGTKLLTQATEAE